MVEIICLILAIILIGGSAYILNKQIKKEKTKVSFKEGLKWTNLPVIIVNQGDNEFKFMLDTGANYSLISSEFLSKFNYSNTDTSGTLYGLEGNKIDVNFVEATITYKKCSFTDDFQVVDMKAPFDNIKASTGVQIHGIIGNNFMQKYKYILDFDSMIAYSK